MHIFIWPEINFSDKAPYWCFFMNCGIILMTQKFYNKNKNMTSRILCKQIVFLVALFTILLQVVFLFASRNNSLAQTECSLAVSLSPGTPAAQTVSPGQYGVSLVKFNLLPNCAIALNSFSVSLNGYTDTSLLHLYDGATQLGAVSVTGPNVDFEGLNLAIPASLTKVLEVKADINSSAMSGSTIYGSFGAFTATSASGSVGNINTSVIVGNVMTVGGYAGDTISPTMPVGLVATKDDYSEVDLRWAASSDNIGVAGYEVWRTNGAWIKLGISYTTAYIDTTVVSGTGYYYKIIAYDAAGNKSPEPPQSAWLFLNTPASTSSPLSPSYVTAESIVGKIVVSWPPATSATKYSIHRKMGTGTYQPLSSNITGSYYDDVSVVTGTAYQYEVMGCDATVCSTTGTESNSVTYNGGGASCTGLTSAINDADTSYVASEPVNFTWTCSPGGIASNVYVKLYKSDGALVSSPNSPTNMGTQTLYLSTLNLSAGSYIIKACFESNCSTTTTSQTFTVVSGTTAVPTFTITPSVENIAGYPNKKLLKATYVSSPSGITLSSPMGKIVDLSGNTMSGSPFNLNSDWTLEYDTSSLASGNYKFCSKGYYTSYTDWVCGTTAFTISNATTMPTFTLSPVVTEKTGYPSKRIMKVETVSSPTGYTPTNITGKIKDSSGNIVGNTTFNLVYQTGGYWIYEYDVSSLGGNYNFCANGMYNTTSIPWACTTAAFAVATTPSATSISIYPDVMNSTGTFKTLQVTVIPAGTNLFNVNGKIRKDGAYGVAAFDNIALSFDSYSNSWRKEFDTINLTNGGSYVFCAKASLDSAGTKIMPEVCTGVFIIDNASTSQTSGSIPQLDVFFQNITPDALKGDVKISIKTSIEPDIVNFKLQRESGSDAFPAAVKIDATNFYFLWSTAQYYDGNYTIYATAKKGSYEKTASVSAYVSNYSTAPTTTATATPATTQTTSSLIITFTDAFQPPLSGDKTISISSNQKMDSCKFKVEGSKYAEFQGTNSGMQCSFVLPTSTFPDGQYLIRAVASSGANTNEIILYTSFSNQAPNQTTQPVSPMPPQTTNDYYIPQECKDKGYTTPEACQNYMMFPPECRSQNILDPEACKSYMYKYGMPPECQNQGVQTPEECQKIIFQNSMPPECKTAGATTKEECDKIMSVQFMLTPECKTANITTADACNTYMIEKFSPPECQNSATQEECGYMVRDSYNTFNTLSPMGTNTIFNSLQPAAENFPTECKEAQITSPDECKNYMMKLSMPLECREANVTTGEECEKIMFKKFGPKECIDAEIMDPTECEKFMFKKYAPEDCKAAGIFNPEACKKYMFEKYGNGDNIPKNKFPIECQKANAATAEECEKVMKTAYMPQECKDKGITNEGECEKYFEKKYMPAACKEAGASTREECDKAMFKKYAPKECLKAGIEKDDECQKFMFNLYAPKVKCDNLEDWQCKKNLEERHLGDVVAKQSQFSQIKERSNELIGKSMKVGDIIKSKAFEGDKMIPITNNDESLRIISTTENMVLNDEDTLTQTGPVAFMIDTDVDELSDDMEKLLGTDPLKEDTDGDGYKDGEETRTGHDPLGPGLLTRTLTPAEKAMVENITLEHPKTSGEVSENLTVEKIENLPAGNEAEKAGYLLSGTSDPDSVLTVYIYSDLPLVLTVKANNEGNWEYKLDRPLAEGEHEIYVVVNDETGRVVNKSKPSSLFIKSAKAVNAVEYLKDPIGNMDRETLEDINSNKYNFVVLFSITGALSIFGIMLILRKKKHQIQK